MIEQEGEGDITFVRNLLGVGAHGMKAPEDPRNGTVVLVQRRCKCIAGESIPSSIPQWRGADEPTVHRETHAAFLYRVQVAKAKA